MDAASDLLAAARPGERWVVRMLLPDGRASDVIGWVEAIGPAAVRLDTGGSVTTIQRALVVAARRAPAAPGGPHPRRITAAELERIALPGWLAEHARLGEWTLRAGGGFTGRANSCLAVGEPGLPLADAAAAVVAWSDRHQIAPWAQVVTGSAEERGLRGLGWQPTYVPTVVLAVRLADLLAGALPEPLPDPRAVVTEELSPGWLAAYRASRPAEVSDAVLHAILAGNPPRAFASSGEATRPSAIGRGHLSRDWLGLAALWTHPAARRQGLATALIRALGHWAARRGARYAYLQVAAANTAAIGAYERLGFSEHHRYGYLAAP